MSESKPTDWSMANQAGHRDSPTLDTGSMTTAQMVLALRRDNTAVLYGVGHGDIADRLEALEAVASALDRCENNRGRFSCAEAHDCRCPAARVKDGQWPPRCECGGDALLAAFGALEATGWQPEETRSE